MMPIFRRAALVLIVASVSCSPAPFDDQAAAGGTTGPVPARLTLLTWNIEYGKAGLDPIADFLKSQAADLIFLQEVSRPGSTRGSGEDQARQIADRVGGLRCVSGVTLDISEAHDCDMVILSRLPLSDALARSYEPGDRVFAVDATVGGLDRPLRVFSVHTHATFKLDARHIWESSHKRMGQVAQLLREVERFDGDVILAGDFNAPMLTPAYPALVGRCVDFGAGASGDHATFQAKRPMLRLDYIFGHGRWRVIDYRVLATTLSDHRPVVAIVERERPTTQ